MGKSLRLEPDVARQIVAECDRLIARLDEHIQDAGQLSNFSGFGDIPSARALRDGFARKATVGESSIVGRLQQFRDQAIQIRDNFAAGGEAFHAAEEQNAEMLRATGSDL